MTCITIVPAPELWGLQTGAVHDALLGPEGKHGQGCVACIGPAGENLVRIAAIINDRGRAAARWTGRGDGQQEPEGAAHHAPRAGPRYPPNCASPPGRPSRSCARTRIWTACGAGARWC